MIRLLYVDDEPSLLELGKLFLERSGYFSVTLAPSAAEGLTLLEMESFDAIISDYQMPDRDGIEFLTDVREKYLDIPFILFTGQGREEIAIQAFERGADFYLQKGGDPKSQFAELIQKVSQAIRRRTAEEDLRAQERQLKSIATNIPGVVFRFYVNPDKTTGFDYISERSRQILGLENDPVTFYDQFVSCLLPEDRERFLISIRDAIDSKRSWEFEVRFVKPSGKKIWLNALSSPSMERDRLVFDGVIMDNTDKWRAENALHLSESYYRALFHYTGSATIIVEEDCTISLANDAFAKLWGQPRREIEGKITWAQFVVPHDLERVKEFHRRRRINPADVPNVYEFRLVTSEGIIRNILIHVGMIPDTKRSVASLLDITERKEALEALQLNEQRLEALLRLEELETATINELALFAMDEAVRLTRSAIGYIAFYDEDERVLTMHAWSKSAMNECRIATKPLRYPIDTTGLWGEAVRQRRPIITNDYRAENARKKGIPHGHVPLVRHMNVPVFDGGRIVIVAGVGNKPSDYDESDVRQVTLLMGRMWRIIQRRKAEVSLQQKTDELLTSYEQIAGTEEELRSQVRMLAENERVIRESEVTYRSIVDSVPAGMHFYHLGPDGRLVLTGANRTADTLLGISHAPLFGKTIEEAFPPLAGTDIPDHYRAVARDRIPWITEQVDYEDERITGAFSVWAFPTLPDTMVVAFYDITEMKQAGHHGKESEERSRKIFDTSPLGMVLVDEKFRFIRVNPAFCRMLGYEESELLVKKFTDITHSDHVDEESENVKKLSRGELTFYNTVKRYIRKDGGVIWASATVSVVRSDDGTFVSFLAVIEDVSEKRELVNTLRESELKYRSLIEEIRDGFFITDAQGTITFANGTLAQLFGYPASAGITGTPFFRYIVPEEEERIGALFRRDIESGTTQDLPIEVNVQRIDGSRFIAEVKAYPILNEGRLVGTRGSIRDISERKRADEAIRLANRKLNLLSSITRHDIRNKLMVIQGFLELSLSEMQSPMLPMYLKKVQESAKTIEEQIGFARDYQDLGIASPKWQEINTVFARASSQCDLQSVEMELQSSGYEIYADPLLEKVFYNLVDNALVHGDHVSSISFSFHESAEGLVIALEDNGEGVRSKDKDRIFLQGFGRKTGLGLFLVSEILSITSITIREVGNEGKGARFEMVVPTGMYRRTPDPV